jgi:hypothetical protein
MTPHQMDLSIGGARVSRPSGSCGGLDWSRCGAGGGGLVTAPQPFVPGRGDLTVTRPHLPGPLRPGPFIASPVGGFRPFHPDRRAPGGPLLLPLPGASNRGVSPLIRRRTVSGFSDGSAIFRAATPSVLKVNSPAGDGRGLFGGM